MKIFKNVAGWATLIFGLISLLSPTVLSFINPKMTNTELMLNYWPHYLVGIVLFWVGCYLIKTPWMS